MKRYLNRLKAGRIRKEINMPVLIILGSIAFIILHCCICSAFHKIAQMKGHYGKSYFWWTFFTGLIGMMMVIALPDRSGAEKSDVSHDDELPDL